MVPLDTQVVELTKIFEPTKQVINHVFGGRVGVELWTGTDPCIKVPVFGLALSVSELRELKPSRNFPVFCLTQEIRIPATSPDSSDVDVDEIGDYVRWQDALDNLCRIIASCFVTQTLDDIAMNESTVQWYKEMDEFYERVVNSGKEAPA